jgi:hypothetical protein
MSGQNVCCIYKYEYRYKYNSQCWLFSTSVSDEGDFVAVQLLGSHRSKSKVLIHYTGSHTIVCMMYDVGDLCNVCLLGK